MVTILRSVLQSIFSSQDLNGPSETGTTGSGLGTGLQGRHEKIMDLAIRHQGSTLKSHARGSGHSRILGQIVF